MKKYENTTRCSIELYKQRDEEVYRNMLNRLIADVPVSELKKAFPLEVLDPTVMLDFSDPAIGLESGPLAAKIHTLARMAEVELTVSFKPE